MYQLSMYSSAIYACISYRSSYLINTTTEYPPPDPGTEQLSETCSAWNPLRLELTKPTKLLKWAPALDGSPGLRLDSLNTQLFTLELG